MALPYGTIFGNFGDEKVTTTVQGANPLGTRMVLPDGRVFYYGQVNGAIGAGAICQAAAGVANHDMDLVVATAGAVGDKSLSVTLGATAATEDQYKDGFMYVNDGAGEGHAYKIQQHDAIASSGTGTINFYDGDAIAEAITTSSLVGLMINPYAEVIIFPTTPTGATAGVCPTEFADNEFGWFQTWGPAAVLCDVAFVIGNHVRVSDNTAGSGEPLVRAASAENDVVIGIATLIAPVTTDYGMVDLTIRP